MAARALTAAGRRAAGRTGTTPLLASCRNGASMNHSSATASARREEEEEQYKDVRAAAAAMTGAQVEAALNRKNVEVLLGEEEHVATVLPDEAIGEGALDGGGEDASWVPDQDTGVFGPAHVDTHDGDGPHPAPPHLFGGATASRPRRTPCTEAWAGPGRRCWTRRCSSGRRRWRTWRGPPPPTWPMPTQTSTAASRTSSAT